MVRGGRGGVAVRLDGLGGKAVDAVSDKVYQSKIPKYARHAAGPWWVGSFAWDIVLDDDTLVGQVCPQMKGQWQANAALIADAPYLACEVERLRELCGELVGAIENIMRLRDTDYGGATAAAWTSSFTGLRIALNKAKGGDE